MILPQTIEIKVIPKTLSHFKKLGYDIKSGDIIVVPVEHLTSSSHYTIYAECDVCKNQTKLSFKDYNKNIKTCGFYSCSSKCSRDKFKTTCNNKYDVDNISQLSSTKNKVKNTIQEKYGVSNVMLVKNFNLKMRESQKNTILNSGNNIIEKRKKTMLEKYDVDNSSKSYAIKQKKKETTLKNYGFDNPSKSEVVKQKKKETTLKNYGVDNPLKNRDIFDKQQISGSLMKIHDLTSLKYRGTYEKHFLDFCFNNNIIIEPGITVKYKFKNKERIYFADFYIKSLNLIIEIKSNYTYKKDLEKNIAKQECCLKSGYNFIFIIDKKYTQLEKLLKN